MSSQLPLVPDVSNPDRDKSRLRIHTQIVASILNSLVRLGILTRTGDDAWAIPGATGGTVTSVAQTVPAEFSIAGSPITTSGTLAITKVTQTANTIWAGPTTGAAAQPVFRALVAADLPAGAGSPLTTKGDLYTFSTVNARLPVGANSFLLSADSTQATGLKWITAPSSGVTSVAMTVPSILSVSGSPITTTGTFAVTLATETANTIFAGPTSGGAAVPTFRVITLASADFVNQGTTTTLLHGNAAGNPSFGAVVTGDITNAAVTLAKIQNAAANSVWLGAGAAGTGAAYTENTFGSGLTVTGTVLSITGSPSSLVYEDGTVPGGNTVASTAAETAFTSSYTVGANTLSVGSVIRIKLFGVYSTALVAPTLAIKVKVGGTLVLTTGTISTLVGSDTNVGWTLEGALVVTAIGASGTLECQGLAELDTAATTGLLVNMTNTAAVGSIDTTVGEAITVTATWGTSSASNTITLRQMLVNTEQTGVVPGGGGSTTDPISSIYPVFTPAGNSDEFSSGSFSGWTAVTPGTHNPTLTQTNNILSVLSPGSDAAANLHAWVKSGTFAAGNFIECAYRGCGPNQTFNIAGVLFADGTTFGSGVQVILYWSPNEQKVALNKHAGYNSTTTLSLTNVVGSFADVFLRLVYNGANSWSAYISADGISWAIVNTQTYTLTPTFAGFFVTTWGGTAAYNWAFRYCKFG